MWRKVIFRGYCLPWITFWLETKGICHQLCYCSIGSIELLLRVMFRIRLHPCTLSVIKSLIQVCSVIVFLMTRLHHSKVLVIVHPLSWWCWYTLGMRDCIVWWHGRCLYCMSRYAFVLTMIYSLKNWWSTPCLSFRAFVTLLASHSSSPLDSDCNLINLEALIRKRMNRATLLFLLFFLQDYSRRVVFVRIKTPFVHDKVPSSSIIQETWLTRRRRRHS